LDRQGGIEDYDVVLKSVPSAPFLSLRSSFDSMDEVVPMVRAIAEEGARQIGPAVRDKLIVISRNDLEDEKLDLEIGFSPMRPSNVTVRIAGSRVLQAGELPAVPTMATIVLPGTNAQSHTSFGAIGTWIEYVRGITALEPFQRALSNETPFAEQMGLHRGFLAQQACAVEAPSVARSDSSQHPHRLVPVRAHSPDRNN
jgi:hypothetical protein